MRNGVDRRGQCDIGSACQQSSPAPRPVQLAPGMPCSCFSLRYFLHFLAFHAHSNHLVQVAQRGLRMPRIAEHQAILHQAEPHPRATLRLSGDPIQGYDTLGSSHSSSSAFLARAWQITKTQIVNPLGCIVAIGLRCSFCCMAST